MIWWDSGEEISRSRTFFFFFINLYDLFKTQTESIGSVTDDGKISKHNARPSSLRSYSVQITWRGNLQSAESWRPYRSLARESLSASPRRKVAITSRYFLRRSCQSRPSHRRFSALSHLPSRSSAPPLRGGCLVPSFEPLKCHFQCGTRSLSARCSRASL